LECSPAWNGNESWDAFLAFAWTGTNGDLALVTVNYAPHDSQCYVHLPYPEFKEQTAQFTDQMSNALYNRNGNDLLSTGLYLDLPPWGYHILKVTAASQTISEEAKIMVAPNHEIMQAQMSDD